MVEHGTENAGVDSSSLSLGTTFPQHSVTDRLRYDGLPDTCREDFAMTALNEETNRTLGYLEGRIDEQSKTLQDLKSGQHLIIERIDRANDRVDRLLLAGWIIGGAVVTAQLGMLGTLIVFILRSGLLS